MYVEMKNINKSFGTFKASDDVSFGLEKGRLCALLGPSGSGKTTILRMIAGLETADSGDIFIDGVRVNDKKASERGIGFVFQSYALFRYMTVFQNIAFGLEVQKKSKSQIKSRVNELISLIGLEGLENRYPSELSGGQKQRVAFARALAPDPQLLLLDEPFAAIDAKVRKELRTWLKNTIEQVGITSIFVTHDQEEAMEVSSDIIVTNAGRIEQAGTPSDIYLQPKTPFVARFIGQSKNLDNYGSLKGFTEIPDTTAVVRPEHIEIFKQGELQKYMSVAENGIAKEVSFRGGYMELKILLENGIEIFGTYPINKSAISEGERVQILVNSLYIFDKNGNTFLTQNDAMKDNDIFYI